MAAPRPRGAVNQKVQSMNIKQFAKSKFARNTFWIMFSRVYQIAVNLVVSVLSVRYLGPSNYGLINYAASFSSLFTAFCTLGIDEVMVNELITKPQKQGKLIGTAIVMRICSSIFSVLTICLIVYALNPGKALTFWVTLLYSFGLVMQSLEVVKYFYQQRLMSKVTSLLTFFVRTIVAVYKIFLLALDKNVLWFAASNVVDHGVFGILLVLCYYHQKDPHQGFRFERSLAKDLMTKSHHFVLSGLMVALYGQMDKIMLKHLMDEAQVGFYSVATTVNNYWPFILTAIIQSARPVIIELFEKDKALFKKRLAQLYSAIIGISAVAAIGISVFAKPIILLLYGDGYLSSVNALRIVTWSTAFSYLGVARSIWVVSNGQQHFEKYLAAIGAVCNAILNYLMIPVWGICGAAIATLITQVVTNFFCGVFFRPLRENVQLMLKALDYRWLFKKQR